MTPTTFPLQFDHLGLIVSDLASARDFLTQTLGITLWTPITDDPIIHVSVQFGTAPTTPSGVTGPTYELIAPFGDASPVANALRQGKHILNHVAYLTPDLDLSAAALRDQGCFAAGPAMPAVAYAGNRVQFFLSPLRFIIELIEKPNHRHIFAAPKPAEPEPAEPEPAA
jgi:methylmalonyl-CoA/ethylmalonyl-CoA epimerase